MKGDESDRPRTGVEVLVKPHDRRHKQAVGMPIDSLSCFVFLPKERITFTVENHDGVIRTVAMSRPFSDEIIAGPRACSMCATWLSGICAPFEKRYVRRDASGHFTEKQVDVGRSLAVDRRSKSKTVVKQGDGDRGDQKQR